MCSHCGLYFSSLKPKSLHGTSFRATEGRIENTRERVRPLRFAARWQREMLCVMAFQEMEWFSMDENDAEDFDLSNITDNEMKMNLVLQSLILMKSLQPGLMKLSTECIDILLLVKYQPKSFLLFKTCYR